MSIINYGIIVEVYTKYEKQFPSHRQKLAIPYLEVKYALNVKSSFFLDFLFPNKAILSKIIEVTENAKLRMEINEFARHVYEKFTFMKKTST